MTDQQTVFLNGNFLPIEEARVPVLDRGFIFGDGIYDVAPVYGGKPFRWAHHLARLKRSMGRIRIDNPKTDEQWTALVEELIGRHTWHNQFIYIQVTRGVARREHTFPADTTPTVFAMSSELIPVAAKILEQGIAVVTLPDERWMNCDIKAVSLLGNILARQSAADAGATECLMFRDGLLTEGSSSNIWIVRNGKVIAPRRDNRILEGIRVSLMEELCQACNLELEFRNITRREVFSADEIFITSATKEIIAATQLDGEAVGDGKPGVLYKKLHKAYQQAKADQG